jgi:tetratricopeptide (TPR) repeat protein
MANADSLSRDAIRDLTEMVRRGDDAQARGRAERLLQDHPGDPALLRFLGLLSCQNGALDRGIAYLEEARAIDPDNVSGHLALVHALADRGDYAKARALCTEDALARIGEPLVKLLADIEQADGRPAAAARLWELLASRGRGDVAIWAQLADARLEAGDMAGAAIALRQALTNAPGRRDLTLKLGTILLMQGASKEAADVLLHQSWDQANEIEWIELGGLLDRSGRAIEAIAMLERAAALEGAGPQAPFELGLLHATHGWLEPAERWYREALTRDPSHSATYVFLALLFEHTNRADELDALLLVAAKAGIPAADMALPRAYALRRRGLWPEALQAAKAIPESFEPIRRAQLLGEIQDRLGEARSAFSEFSTMNELTAQAWPNAASRARVYREEIAARLVSYSSARIAREISHARVRNDGTDPSPIFLMGPPRSGTTLLDTLLLGHPKVTVLEELPIVQESDAPIRRADQLYALGDEALNTIRKRYCAATREASGRSVSTIIDKHPLHLLHLPLLHRLFPDARFIFLERHPCDVVLSCFVTNFAMNDAMASFLDLEEAAALYDLLMRCWTQWSRALPIQAHVIRYENLILSAEDEMRKLIRFLSLDWDDAVLRHRETAARRPYIASASYAQVGEAMHGRSIERWRRYREELDPIFRPLSPWVESMSYSL